MVPTLRDVSCRWLHNTFTQRQKHDIRLMTNSASQNSCLPRKRKGMLLAATHRTVCGGSSGTDSTTPQRGAPLAVGLRPCTSSVDPTHETGVYTGKHARTFDLSPCTLLPHSHATTNPIGNLTNDRHENRDVGRLCLK
jgi:hypothetical protein